MKTRVRIFLAILGILASACGNERFSWQASLTPSATTASQTPIPTAFVTSVPTSSPTIAPMLSWSEATLGKKFFLGAYVGTWSPVADELLLVSHPSLPDVVSLKVAVPPYFDATTLTNLYLSPGFESVAWSPDGQNIAFIGPLSNTTLSNFDGQVTLWVAPQ